MSEKLQPRAHIRCIIVVFILAEVLCLPHFAFAGGPKYIAGTTYFNSDISGIPLTWLGGAITYYTDQGNLSSFMSEASADALVADAWSQWASIPTVALTATRSGQLAEDVSGPNVSVNPDGSINLPPDITPGSVATPVAIVYDNDGSVTDALLGAGAGASDSCFTNAVYGGLDNFGPDAHFLHALIVMNGNCAQGSAQLPDMEYRLVRTMGRVLGLDWSQLNLNVITGGRSDRPPTNTTVSPSCTLPTPRAAFRSACVIPTTGRLIPTNQN